MAFLGLPLSDVLKSTPEQEVKPLPKKGRRMYAGAQTSRLTSNWIAGNSSADAEIKGSLKQLRQRARQIGRDNPYGRQAIRSIVSNVVGPVGFKIQSQIKQQRGKKLDQKLNDVVETRFKRWGRADSCDVAGRLSWVEMQKLIVNSLVVDGEVFIRIIRKPFGRSSIPFSLQVMEADLLDTDYTGKSSNGNIYRMGIEVNEFNRPVNYCFLTKHPGDTLFPARTGEKRHLIIPADEIIHLFQQERPSQSRGVPAMASCLKALHDLNGFQEASVIRARAASSLMGFITSPEGELDAGGEVYEEERVTQFEPGVFKYLDQGQQISVPDFDSPNGEFPEFMAAMLRSVAAGCGVSYESVSRDFSKTNYSSSRLSLLEDRSQYRSIQNYLIDNFHTRVFEAWLEMAVLSGNLNLPNYESDPDRYRRVRFVPRGWEWVDPQKEIAAAKEAVKAGFKTVSQIVLEQGGDYESLLPQRADEVEKAKQLNLVFDTDLSSGVTTSAKQTIIDENQTETNGKET